MTETFILIRLAANMLFAISKKLNRRLKKLKIQL
jgi:hypothetical protein